MQIAGTPAESIRGKRPVNQQLLMRRQRVSALALISTNGLLDVKVVKETEDGDSMISWHACSFWLLY